MDAKGFVVLPGQGPVWDMAPGRSAAFKMQRGETAVDWRVVILNSSRDSDQSCFEIAHQRNQLFFHDWRAGKFRERTHEGDGQRGRSAEAGAAPTPAPARSLPPATLIWPP